MRNILLITSRNVIDESGEPTGVGAATLIYRRASAIYKELGVKTFIFPLNGKNFKKNMVYEGCYLLNNQGKKVKLIKDFILKNSPSIIIYSGEKTYFLHKRLKKIIGEIPVYLDIHGALEEGIEYNSGIKKTVSYFRYNLKKYYSKKMIKNVEGLLVVSDELFEHYIQLLDKQIQQKVKCIKVRCGINDVLSTAFKKEAREEIRRKWAINNDTKVFVYSGYRAKWQCINETIEHFKFIDKNMDNVFFAFFTQSDDQFEYKLRESLPKSNYYVGLIPPNKIYKYLSACDVGMLIRHDNYTNNVAFPNKFSDYLNSGLLLMMSNSLREPMRILNENKISYIEAEPNVPIRLDELSIIDDRKANLLDYYMKSERVCRNELKYSEQIINNRYIFG